MLHLSGFIIKRKCFKTAFHWQNLKKNPVHAIHPTVSLLVEYYKIRYSKIKASHFWQHILVNKKDYFAVCDVVRKTADLNLNLGAKNERFG